MFCGRMSAQGEVGTKERLQATAIITASRGARGMLGTIKLDRTIRLLGTQVLIQRVTSN